MINLKKKVFALHNKVYIKITLLLLFTLSTPLSTVFVAVMLCLSYNSHTYPQGVDNFIHIIPHTIGLHKEKSMFVFWII